jgi:hypothetical protein
MALDEQDLEKIKEITGALMAEMKAETTKMVNGAIKSLDVKGLREKVESQLASADPEALGKTVEEKIAAALEAVKKATPAQGAGAGQAKQIDEETAKAVKELRDANEALQKRLKDRDAADQAEKARRAVAEEKQAMTTALTKLGVKPALIEPAVEYLRSRGLVARDSEQNIIVKGKDDTTGLDITHSLDDGLGGWLKTDVGKEFLPPKPVSGSGQGQERGANGRGGQGRQFSLAEMAATLDEGGE